MKKIEVGIVGGSGWAGAELIRLLLQHDGVSISVITSRGLEGKSLSSLFPNFIGQSDLHFSLPIANNLTHCDLVFFATPHGVAMELAPQLLEKGVRVIDLGADFRLQNIKIWENFYNMTHTQTAWVKKAIYGLPEYNRDVIKNAELIANPGCYPTAVSLALKPLLTGHIELDNIIADCKSGVSGAGRVNNIAMSLCEASESFKAYGTAGHRHLPEIEQVLSKGANDQVELTFIPHLIPMIRGMQASVYTTLKKPVDVQEVHQLFVNSYKDEPFVQVLPLGGIPETRAVKTSNTCQIGIQVLNKGKRLVIFSVIDNLIKGASGQAIQNMNIMFCLPEAQGLPKIGILP